MAPPKQYILIKSALDAVESHSSLCPKVTGRWITADRLHQLVKMQLVNSPLKDLDPKRFNRGLITHAVLKDRITRQKNSVGLYRLGIARDFFYWIGDNPKFPRPFTSEWKKRVLEAEERAFSNRHDASVPQGNTVRADDSVAQGSTVRADASVPQGNTVRADASVSQGNMHLLRGMRMRTRRQLNVPVIMSPLLPKAKPLEVLRWTGTRTRRQPNVSAMKLLSQR
jgi:hypothetical protein